MEVVDFGAVSPLLRRSADSTTFAQYFVVTDVVMSIDVVKVGDCGCWGQGMGIVQERLQNRAVDEFRCGNQALF